MQLFRDPEHMIETKMIVHGYLGYKASKEMEQFFTHGELKRIARYEDGIRIAPMRSTFKVIYPMYFQKSLTLFIRIHLLRGRFYHIYIRSKMKFQ